MTQMKNRVVRMVSAITIAVVLATMLALQGAAPANASTQALNCDPIRQGRVLRAQSAWQGFWSNQMGTYLEQKAELWQAVDIYDGNFCRAIWAKGLYREHSFLGFCNTGGTIRIQTPVYTSLRYASNHAKVVGSGSSITQCDVTYGIFASNLPWTQNGTYKGRAHFGTEANPVEQVAITGPYTMSV